MKPHWGIVVLECFNQMESQDAIGVVFGLRETAYGGKKQNDPLWLMLRMANEAVRGG